MHNLSLIDRPKTLTGLEYFDIMIATIVSGVVAVVLALVINILFIALFPFMAILCAIWLKEKKRNKNYGYLQRLMMKWLSKGEKKSYVAD